MTNDASRPVNIKEPLVGKSVRSKILIESIIRAGLLAIPVVGASLEKLTYSRKDAISAEELRQVVNSIEEELKCHNNSQLLTDLDVENITSRIIAKPELQRIVYALESASTNSISNINQLLLEIARLSAKTDLLSNQLLRENEITKQSHKDLSLLIRESAERYERTLNQVLSELRKTKRKPKELLKILDSPEVKEMLLHISYMKSAEYWVQTDSSVMLAVDTGVFVEYLDSDWQERVRSPSNVIQSTVLFEHCQNQLHLLPTVSNELARWIKHFHERLFYSIGNLGRGNTEQSLRYIELSNMKRKMEVLSKIIPWPIEENIIDRIKLSDTHDCIHTFLNQRAEKKLRSHLSMYNDALSLAYLARYNHDNKDADNKIALLISNDLFLTENVQYLRICETPLAIQSTVWMYRIFLIELRNNNNVVYNNNLPETKGALNLFNRILEILKKPAIDEVMYLSSNLDLIISSLSIYGEYFKQFQRWLMCDILTMKLESYHYFPGDVLKAHQETMTALLELDAHLEKLREAYEVFEQTNSN